MRELKTKNYQKITEIYAFISSDEDGEGIISQSMNIDGVDMIMPFVCADKVRMEKLKPLAKKISELSGKKVKLIRLTVREEIEF